MIHSTRLYWGLLHKPWYNKDPVYSNNQDDWVGTKGQLGFGGSTGRGKTGIDSLWDGLKTPKKNQWRNMQNMCESGKISFCKKINTHVISCPWFPGKIAEDDSSLEKKNLFLNHLNLGKTKELFSVSEINWISRWWFQTFSNFHPYLGKIPILTNIFQMGWNHQPVMVCGNRVLLLYWELPRLVMDSCDGTAPSETIPM